MTTRAVIKFTGKHRREMVAPAHAKMIESQIALMPMPEETRFDLIRTLRSNTASETKWTFVMLSPQQNADITQWLAKHSKRPKEALLLWAQLFTAMRMDTGEIMMTRGELAEATGSTAQNVSRIMTELASINAITRIRRRVAGMPGPGRVHYFMNPNVATHIGGARSRETAQANAGQLNIIDFIQTKNVEPS